MMLTQIWRGALSWHILHMCYKDKYKALMELSSKHFFTSGSWLLIIATCVVYIDIGRTYILTLPVASISIFYLCLGGPEKVVPSVKNETYIGSEEIISTSRH